VYSGRRDTTARLKALLQHAGLKAAVLRASVDTSKREDWILDQVDRGIDVLICNPELVKTGLDLLDFPSIVFMQTGYNIYVRPEVA
jgi:excinuclease UvrABC helicase subunit UvrB